MIIEQIVKKLQPFFSDEINAFRENGEDTYELFNLKTGERVGYFLTNDKVELDELSCIRNDLDDQRIERKDIEKRAEAFLNVFCSNNQGIELKTFTEMEDQYFLGYETREPTYGLFLPGSGYSLAVTFRGEIRSFSRHIDSYEIKYTEELIDEKTALQQFIDSLSFELTILKVDQTAFQLVYQVNKQLIDIPIDGTKPESLDTVYPIKTRVLVDKLPASQLSKIQTTPRISEAEAKTIFKQHVKMKLRFVGEWNEDGVYTYSLAYIPSYLKKGKQYVINAFTGQLMNVTIEKGTLYSN